jgi:hypothetical protein
MKKNTFWWVILMLFLGRNFAFAQSDSTATIREEGHYDQVFFSVQEMPEFTGRMDSFFKHLAATINYPAEAKSKNLQGIVYAYFVIEKDGNLSGAEVK